MAKSSTTFTDLAIFSDGSLRLMKGTKSLEMKLSPKQLVILAFDALMLALKLDPDLIPLDDADPPADQVRNRPARAGASSGARRRRATQ